ncbi:MAG: DUF4080 domain-containing protein, partial [Nannocystaceae bacterium]
MPALVLTTLNASYTHSSLALRYLKANLGPHTEDAVIREFIISARPIDIVEELLQDDPKIIAFGVYVWNVVQTQAVLEILKAVRPDIDIILGGPEVSYEIEDQSICRIADYIVPGEAELAFTQLVARLLSGRRPLTKVRPVQLPQPADLVSPYELYTDEDIQKRSLYVEASRGCPFSCEFCLSSLPIKVRSFDIQAFLADLENLWQRGARQFRFIDRTFNLSYVTATQILNFFVDRKDDGIFVHFEMVPDRFPERLRELVKVFPPGALQFEIGVQTFDEATAERIGRRQNNAAVIENIRFLREHTGVHMHADLIAGLPGEDLETFGRGFNQLWAAGPHEIQLGILKRLRGTPIARHDATWGMAYAPFAPYEVLQTNHIPFAEMQRIKRVARVWDLIANRGNFVHAMPLFERRGDVFAELMALTEWLYVKTGAFVGIELIRLCNLLLEYFTGPAG